MKRKRQAAAFPPASSASPHQPSHARQLREQLEEFRALVDSDYAHYLNPDLISRIRQMIDQR